MVKTVNINSKTTPISDKKYSLISISTCLASDSSTGLPYKNLSSYIKYLKPFISPFSHISNHQKPCILKEESPKLVKSTPTTLLLSKIYHCKAANCKEL